MNPLASIAQLRADIKRLEQENETLLKMVVMDLDFAKNLMTKLGKESQNLDQNRQDVKARHQRWEREVEEMTASIDKDLHQCDLDLSRNEGCVMQMRGDSKRVINVELWELARKGYKYVHSVAYHHHKYQPPGDHRMLNITDGSQTISQDKQAQKVALRRSNLQRESSNHPYIMGWTKINHEWKRILGPHPASREEYTYTAKEGWKKT
ncbi:MAG: hypothetical protein S4CHLAM45_07970 [Chlamydiales bacterium]|nr:hypothetical protein [Chlamydiales bacterium]MCH9619993.1 hypothetical protein [Chlamydiales bacterium]MCH9622903.1 hypothetical protein [Chlamydiales bacterium]